MKIEKDHDKYDYLSVSLKSEYSEEIMKCYLALGWKDVHMEEDKDYADMKYVLFSRPHDTPNKDRLQYVQVRMENILNSISERSIKRHAKSTALAVLLGIFGLLFVAAGLSIALILSALAYKIYGYICVGIGAIMLLGLIYPLTKLRKKENEKLKSTYERNFSEFEKFVKEAARLSSAEVEFEGLKKEIAVGAEA